MSQSDRANEPDKEIAALVSGFESCTTKPSEFDHRAHVTVAFAYLHLFRLSVPEATARMRESLLRFVNHHGVDPAKYNETITLFWIKLVRSVLNKQVPSSPLSDLASAVVDECNDPHLIFKYYSKECLGTDEARKGWVEPDLRSVDF